MKEGELEVVSEDGDIVFATLRAGTVFGELSILDIPGLDFNINFAYFLFETIAFSEKRKKSEVSLFLKVL